MRKDYWIEPRPPERDPDPPDNEPEDDNEWIQEQRDDEKRAAKHVG